MIQQIQQQCPECNGTGYLFRKEKETSQLEVNVNPGMCNGDKIRFANASEEKPNATFKRKNADLLYQKNLTLSEALCGFEFVITHLDGRQILVKSKPGEVVCPEAANGEPYVKVIENEGMPKKGSPFDKGRLFIYFRVVFPRPSEMTDEKRA